MWKSSLPDTLMPDVKQLEKMNRNMTALLPKELARAANLMAHPVAGFAAASAIGFGLASQAVGFWMGAFAGAAEASTRFLASIDAAGRETTSAPGPKTPAARARAATRTLIADAQLAANEVVETAAKLVRTEPEAGKATVDKRATADRVGAAELMPEDFVQPKPMKKPAKPDDLKAISGVGPKLEAVLNDLGIWTYGQIAAWKAEEIAWVEDYLGFKGRIGRDGWQAQAGRLAAGKPKK
jgi:NADH-quinone oxidoreductase subunit E